MQLNNTSVCCKTIAAWFASCSVYKCWVQVFLTDCMHALYIKTKIKQKKKLTEREMPSWKAKELSSWSGIHVQGLEFILTQSKLHAGFLAPLQYLLLTLFCVRNLCRQHYGKAFILAAAQRISNEKLNIFSNLNIWQKGYCNYSIK